MFINQLRTAVVAAATLADIATLERTIWQTAWPTYVGDTEADELARILHARRKALTAAAATKVVGFTKPPRPRITRTQKAAAIERRRRLAACWPLPPAQAAAFTTCELAALRVVADDLKRNGVCTMFVEKIAAIAGTCRTVVKNALRKARALRLVTVEERRRRGQRSLTNVVRFLCKTWRQWIERRRGGVIFPTTTNQKFEITGSSGAVERPASGLARVGIARLVPASPT